MKINRRKFIKRIIIAIASIEAFFVIKKGIHKTRLSDNMEQLIDAGRVDSFRKNMIYPFTTGHFYLKRYEDGGFLALSVKCTHLGCVVNSSTETGGFICPCHASRFNAFGEVLSPPATRPLDTYPITIIDGELFVDISKPVKRRRFLKSQLTYA